MTTLETTVPSHLIRLGIGEWSGATNSNTAAGIVKRGEKPQHRCVTSPRQWVGLSLSTVGSTLPISIWKDQTVLQGVALTGVQEKRLILLHDYNPGGHLQKCRSHGQEKCRKSASESAGPKRGAEEGAEKSAPGSAPM